VLWDPSERGCDIYRSKKNRHSTSSCMRGREWWRGGGRLLCKARVSAGGDSRQRERAKAKRKGKREELATSSSPFASLQTALRETTPRRSEDKKRRNLSSRRQQAEMVNSDLFFLIALHIFCHSCSFCPIFLPPRS